MLSFEGCFFSCLFSNWNDRQKVCLCMRCCEIDASCYLPGNPGKKKQVKFYYSCCVLFSSFLSLPLLLSPFSPRSLFFAYFLESIWYFLPAGIHCRLEISRSLAKLPVFLPKSRFRCHQANELRVLLSAEHIRQRCQSFKFLFFIIGIDFIYFDCVEEFRLSQNHARKHCSTWQDEYVVPQTLRNWMYKR